MKIRMSPNIAVCLYTFHWLGLIKGEIARGSGTGTSVLVMEGGKWFLLAEHLGPNSSSNADVT